MILGKWKEKSKDWNKFNGMNFRNGYGVKDENEKIKSKILFVLCLLFMCFV